MGGGIGGGIGGGMGGFIRYTSSGCLDSQTGSFVIRI
jgi:hypothetical protein